MFKVNSRNTRTRCEICSKLTIKTPERRHWGLVFLLLTLSRLMSAGIFTNTYCGKNILKKVAFFFSLKNGYDNGTVTQGTVTQVSKLSMNAQFEPISCHRCLPSENRKPLVF